MGLIPLAPFTPAPCIIERRISPSDGEHTVVTRLLMMERLTQLSSAPFSSM